MSSQLSTWTKQRHATVQEELCYCSQAAFQEYQTGRHLDSSRHYCRWTTCSGNTPALARQISTHAGKISARPGGRRGRLGCRSTGLPGGVWKAALPCIGGAGQVVQHCESAIWRGSCYQHPTKSGNQEQAFLQRCCLLQWHCSVLMCT